MRTWNNTRGQTAKLAFDLHNFSITRFDDWTTYSLIILDPTLISQSVPVDANVLALLILNKSTMKIAFY